MMKKIINFLIVFSVFLFLSRGIVYARSGCCSWHGGVCGCRCCDGTPLSSTCAPYYPECSGGYTHSVPTLTPSCPSMSYYDNLSDSCKCYSGYVTSGDRCISQDQACKNQYGYNSQTNYTGGCECRYGYVWDSSRTSCISGDQSCWNKYGYNSTFDSLNNTCKCSYGYLFNDSGTSCISEDDYCRDKFGFGSRYNSLYEKCECKSGYKLQDSKCVLDMNEGEDDIKSSSFIIPTVIILPSKIPSPIFTSIPTVTLKSTITPTLTIVPTKSPTPIPLTKSAVKGVSTNQSMFSFWKWILSLFGR